MRYEFEWDEEKADANEQKHGIAFETAMAAFRDPLAISMFDESHSEDEERWITVGRIDETATVVVVHTFLVEGPGLARIRLISARKATRRECEQYEEG